jgi:hypothetical protein
MHIAILFIYRKNSSKVLIIELIDEPCCLHIIYYL